jgi:hypothetical protein
VAGLALVAPEAAGLAEAPPDGAGPEAAGFAAVAPLGAVDVLAGLAAALLGAGDAAAGDDAGDPGAAEPPQAATSTVREVSAAHRPVRCTIIFNASLPIICRSLPLAVMSRILVKSAWGSDDPTKACLAFVRANSLAEAGHEVQLFLEGEAVGLMRDSLSNVTVPVGWPPLKEILPKTIELGLRIHL